MANEEHFTILNQGIAAWNSWREDNPFIRPDLSNAPLKGRDLGWEARSAGAMIRANFSEVNLESANLAAADFSLACLSGANLRATDLRGTRLCEADLRYTDFSRANLRGADLTLADLSRSILYFADLANACLQKANLTGTNLSRAKLTAACFGGAVCSGTIFGDVDLREPLELDSINHVGPSMLGIQTLVRSQAKIPEVFLRGAGVPDNFIKYMSSLVGTAFEFYSCFISYSNKDFEFAKRLYTDLQAEGVRCWYFPEDARIGRPVWGEIDASIELYDKLVVVCSANSLQSGPVNREIERALQREDRDNSHVLFPIRIDEYVFATWQHERRADVLNKVIGDFSKWKDGRAYQEAFDRLLRDLGSKRNTKSATLS